MTGVAEYNELEHRLVQLAWLNSLFSYERNNRRPPNEPEESLTLRLGTGVPEPFGICCKRR